MESHIRTIVAILLTCSSLLLVLAPPISKVQALPPHSPIMISSNSGFTPANGVIGGAGTKNDPFIIGNFEIITDTTVGIDIRGGASPFVTAYFVIRNVLIQPPDLTAPSTGILFETVQNGIVDNVTIANFTYGVQLLAGSSDEVSNSTILRNSFGISVSNTMNAQISGNRLFNNTKEGIQVNTSGGTFTGNNASSNGNVTDGSGFYIVGSNNLFEANNATGNTWFGMKMQASSNNVFRNNIISHNGNATGGGGLVLVDNSSRNSIIGNNVTSQNNCLGLEWAPSEISDSYNNITQNRVVGCLYAGIYLDNATYNIIYNNYLSNPSNTRDDSLLNSWNVTKRLQRNILGGPFVGGNFYSDYSGGDPDGDGIGDISYSIANDTMTHPNHDFQPLVLSQPSVVHDVAALGISVVSNPPRAGASVSLTIATFNRGTVPETFQVNATFKPQSSLLPPTLIGTVTVTGLAGWSATTVGMSWNTLTLGAGVYVLVAEASEVPGETNTTNNVSPTTTVTLTVNQPPVANFTISNLNPSAGETVTLNATSSYDPDGTVVSYSWNFGDSTPTGSTEIVTHAWTLAGNYLVSLSVVDNEGSPSVYTKDVTVAPAQPGMPTTLQLSATNGKAALSWTAPSDSGGSPVAVYLVYRGATATGPWTNIANTTSTSYSDTSVASGQTYYYQVRTMNQAGLLSQGSPAQSILVPATSSSPLNNPATWVAIGAILASGVAVGILQARKRPKAKRTPSSTNRNQE